MATDQRVGGGQQAAAGKRPRTESLRQSPHSHSLNGQEYLLHGLRWLHALLARTDRINQLYVITALSRTLSAERYCDSLATRRRSIRIVDNMQQLRPGAQLARRRSPVVAPPCNCSSACANPNSNRCKISSRIFKTCPPSASATALAMRCKAPLASRDIPPYASKTIGGKCTPTCLHFSAVF